VYAIVSVEFMICLIIALLSKRSNCFPVVHCGSNWRTQKLSFPHTHQYITMEPVFKGKDPRTGLRNGLLQWFKKESLSMEDGPCVKDTPYAPKGGGKPRKGKIVSLPLFPIPVHSAFPLAAHEFMQYRKTHEEEKYVYLYVLNGEVDVTLYPFAPPLVPEQSFLIRRFDSPSNDREEGAKRVSVTTGSNVFSTDRWYPLLKNVAPSTTA
jgi:hypothetical protein